MALLSVGVAARCAHADQDTSFDEESLLRCGVAKVRNEVRLLGCMARCDDAKDAAAASGEAFDRPACQSRCSDRHERSSTRVKCADPSETLFAEDLNVADAHVLQCHARRTLYEQQLALCRNRCDGSAADSACEASCQATFDERKETLSPNGDCLVFASDKQEYQGPMRDPNLPVETVHVDVPTPDGSVEADVELRNGFGVFEGDILVDPSKKTFEKRGAGRKYFTTYGATSSSPLKSLRACPTSCAR
jgi:hypothetical protein